MPDRVKKSANKQGYPPGASFFGIKKPMSRSEDLFRRTHADEITAAGGGRKGQNAVWKKGYQEHRAVEKAVRAKKRGK